MATIKLYLSFFLKKKVCGAVCAKYPFTEKTKPSEKQRPRKSHVSTRKCKYLQLTMTFNSFRNHKSNKNL